MAELKSGRNFLCYRGIDVSDIDKEIEQKEMAIMKFISGLGQQHLKSIIYMSLDINVDVGFPDKLQK